MKKKTKIKGMDISLKEKKIRFHKLKRKCINCRKNGGSLFTNTNGILKVVCGHKKKPCSLNIEIKKAYWEFIPSAIKQTKQDLQKIKEKIIITKLDFLFGLETEDTTMKIFEWTKQRFDETYKLLTNLEVYQSDSYEEKSRKEMVDNLRLQLYGFNNDFKNNIQQYQITGEVSLLRDTIKMYIKRILPLKQRIHYFIYATIYVDEEDGKNILRTHRLDIRQKEEEWEEGDVISNLK